MNAIVERSQSALATSATPADLLRMAVEQGADLDRLERLMALQERWQAAQAKRAYDEAFAAFKAEGVKILKNRTVTAGPLDGKKYAELFAVVNAVTPALSAHGLSTSWRLTKDEKDWIEVTCYLRHVGGHQETATMGGPPDTGGAKSAIQARASTVSYLERYTIKAVLGMSEQDDDKDGAVPGSDELGQKWIDLIEMTPTAAALAKVWKDAVADLRAKAPKDMRTYRLVKEATEKRGKQLTAREQQDREPGSDDGFVAEMDAAGGGK